MSEYQYYEFRAVDRPLDARERSMLRSLSTRGEITAASFVNTYSWGNFKGDPYALMEQCFDAFVYVANWGTRRLSLRLPESMLRRETLSSYCQSDGLRARMAGGFVIVDFCTENEPGDEDWYEGNGWMASLIGLRAELARGDDRCLYLGWLLCAQNEELDDEDIEPPVPAGLRSLSPSLAAFVDFMRVDVDWLEVAASRSEDAPNQPARDELAAWIGTMPAKEKDDLLMAAALDVHAHTGAELLRRFELAGAAMPISRTQPRRTVGELLASADKVHEERLIQAGIRRAAEQARKEREEAAARALYLDRLAERRDAVWKDVAALIQTKKPGKYDRAVQLLLDLRDLAARDREDVKFRSALGQMQELHSTKPNLLSRIAAAGL